MQESVVEVTVGSARDLKNVNWRHGELKPYVVLWINDDGPKCSTSTGELNPDCCWDWADDKVIVPSSASLSDAVLHIDVVHADDVKPLVGSASLPLRDVIDDAGIGGKAASRTLHLKRPSGRPQGRLDVRVAFPGGYPSPYYPAGVGTYYGQPEPPPSGYPAPPLPPPPPVVDDPSQQSDKKSKMGLAVGAAAGVLGGLALAGGASYLEDKFEENVADKVEEDLAARDEDY